MGLIRNFRSMRDAAKTIFTANPQMMDKKSVLMSQEWWEQVESTALLAPKDYKRELSAVEIASRRWFGLQADQYDADMYFSDQALTCIDYILDKIYLSSIDVLLDAGCGTGSFIQKAVARSLVKHAEGLDISPDMLRVAKAKNIPSADFTEGVMSDLPYADKSFDSVFCILALHHCPFPALAIKEFVRVLKPGGKLVIADAGFDGMLGNIIQLIERRTSTFTGDYLYRGMNETLASVINVAPVKSVKRHKITWNLWCLELQF